MPQFINADICYFLITGFYISRTDQNRINVTTSVFFFVTHSKVRNRHAIHVAYEHKRQILFIQSCRMCFVTAKRSSLNLAFSYYVVAQDNI